MELFQSPMGIVSSAKQAVIQERDCVSKVSIPDGDSFLREDNNRYGSIRNCLRFQSPMGIVSSAKQNGQVANPCIPKFQSPMGIVSSAKGGTNFRVRVFQGFQSPMGIVSSAKLPLVECLCSPPISFNPRWG